MTSSIQNENRNKLLFKIYWLYHCHCKLEVNLIRAERHGGNEREHEPLQNHDKSLLETQFFNQNGVFWTFLHFHLFNALLWQHDAQILHRRRVTSTAKKTII